MIFKPFLKLPRWSLSAVCTALICYLTLVPKPLPDNDIPFWEHTDKLVHAIMFGAMYTCLALDIWRGCVRPPMRAAWLLALGVTCFGAIIEVAQQAMGLGRGGDVVDLAADAVGTVTALFMIQKISLVK